MSSIDVLEAVVLDIDDPPDVIVAADHAPENEGTPGGEGLALSVHSFYIVL